MSPHELNINAAWLLCIQANGQVYQVFINELYIIIIQLLILFHLIKY